MVFANSTARSAALTVPTEGMTTYLEDTNKVEVWTGAAWTDINDNTAAIPKSTVTTAGDLIIANGNASVTRLGIGTNGQVLSSNGTTATWTSPSSGGWTLLSTTNLTGSTINLTSISQDYKTLWLKASAVNVSSGTGKIFIRPNGGSVSMFGHSTTTTVATSGFISNLDFGSNANALGTFSAFIYDYTSTGSNKDIAVFGRNNQSTGIFASGSNGDTIGAFAATTSLEIGVSSGNFTNGTLKLYGGN
jgi:hypothetical protein